MYQYSVWNCNDNHIICIALVLGEKPKAMHQYENILTSHFFNTFDYQGEERVSQVFIEYTWLINAGICNSIARGISVVVELFNSEIDSFLGHWFKVTGAWFLYLSANLFIGDDVR